MPPPEAGQAEIDDGQRVTLLFQACFRLRHIPHRIDLEAVAGEVLAHREQNGRYTVNNEELVSHGHQSLGLMAIRPPAAEGRPLVVPTHVPLAIFDWESGIG